MCVYKIKKKVKSSKSAPTEACLTRTKTLLLKRLVSSPAFN